jgi:hypothetical protein
MKNAARLHGGAVLNQGGSKITLINCVFVHNSADEDGGGVFNWPSSDGPAYANLIDCTLAANTSRARAGGLVNARSCSSTLSNCILWANTGNAAVLESAQLGGEGIAVSHSCIQGWSGKLGGAGNLGLDPLFVDPNGPDGKIGTPDDDFRLGLSSPCRDAGENSVIPIDQYDLDGDGDLNEPMPFDIGGRPRIQNGRVDIGAYESDSLSLGR